ncbi:MAG TPA: O-antigen ligase domain-containing protein [Gammaproteobacteria bacterium]|nr:O-antigen ligase domain-containing protein [Gammaproteobacteria bacterium]
MAILLALFKINRTPWVIRGILLMSILVPIYWTGSRGALLGAIVLLLAYWIFGMRPQVRRALFIPLFLISLVSVFAYETTKPVAEEHVSFKQVDTHGTFEYRAQLLRISMQVIPDHLWFGTRLYKKDRRMQKLVQGMGIIDMVNGYVHLAIEWGMICLLIFLYIVLRGYFQMARNISTDDEETEPIDEDEPRPRYDVIRAVSQALAAILVSLSLQFAFTSYSSTIILVIWLTLAIVRAIRNINYVEEIALEEGLEPVSAS